MGVSYDIQSNKKGVEQLSVVEQQLTTKEGLVSGLAMNSDKNRDELPVTCSKCNMIFEYGLDYIRFSSNGMA
jgi:hypothetical protein